MKINTDLSKRERVRFVRNLRNLADSSEKLADELERNDDGAAVQHLLGVVISGMMVNELLEIFKDAIKADLNADEFDRIANKINREENKNND